MGLERVDGQRLSSTGRTSSAPATTRARGPCSKRAAGAWSTSATASKQRRPGSLPTTSLSTSRSSIAGRRRRGRRRRRMSVRRHAAAPDLPRRTRRAVVVIVARARLDGADRRPRPSLAPRTEPRPADIRLGGAHSHAGRRNPRRRRARARSRPLSARSTSWRFQRSPTPPTSSTRSRECRRPATRQHSGPRSEATRSFGRAWPAAWSAAHPWGTASNSSTDVPLLCRSGSSRSRRARAYATQASWRRLTFDLQWERGRWRVTGGAGGAAPSPSSTGQAAVLEASTYRELRHAP